MLKFSYPTGLVIVAAVALPEALSIQSIDAGQDAAVEATLTAIDELAAISSALERREAGAIQRVLDMTQPPFAEPAVQDEFLAKLREEVGDLRLALEGDVVRTGGSLAPRWSPGGIAQPVDISPEANAESVQSESSPGTTGDALPQPTSGGAGSAPSTGAAQGAAPLASRTQAHAGVRLRKLSLEAEGYNADALRQGRLLFRAGRFQEAIDVLAPLEADAEAKYWVARAYEALGDEHEAAVRYRQLSDESGADEYIARRAAQDLDFLEWKQRFDAQGEQ